MTCPRCEALTDAEIALGKTVAPLLDAAARSYLQATELPHVSEGPRGLTHTEEKLFSLLFRASPHPVTFEVILFSIGTLQRYQSLKTTVANMRRKLGDEYRIIAVRGIGYRMVWEDGDGSHVR